MAGMHNRLGRHSDDCHSVAVGHGVRRQRFHHPESRWVCRRPNLTHRVGHRHLTTVNTNAKKQRRTSNATAQYSCQTHGHVHIMHAPYGSVLRPIDWKPLLCAPPAAASIRLSGANLRGRANWTIERFRLESCEAEQPHASSTCITRGQYVSLSYFATHTCLRVRNLIRGGAQEQIFTESGGIWVVIAVPAPRRGPPAP
jgi:hypothetical protein